MLVSRLPDGTVRTDEQIRRERASDSWALALLRRVRGELRAGRVLLDADQAFGVEADGEVLGTTPATFGVIAGAIRLKV